MNSPKLYLVSGGLYRCYNLPCMEASQAGLVGLRQDHITRVRLLRKTLVPPFVIVFFSSEIHYLTIDIYTTKTKINTICYYTQNDVVVTIQFKELCIYFSPTRNSGN